MSKHTSPNMPLPPMTATLWGTPAEAKPLSSSVQKILKTFLDADIDAQPHPAEADIPIAQVTLDDIHVQALSNIIGADYVSQSHQQRIRHARGKSYPDLLAMRASKPVTAPDVVVAPHTEEEVLALLQYCTEHHIAVVPFGGGTSVVGGLTPLNEGFNGVVSLDLARFDRLEDVDPVSLEATLGAGLSGPHAELLLAEHNLQLGHFPQSFPYASIGGFAATRSSGQSSAGYGRFDEMVRSVTVVTPTGISEIGYNAPASAAGPDLRHLFLGSEGTLGIITRVRVRVHEIPATKRYEAFSFPDFESGAHALRKVTQTGTGPTVLRLSDEIESSVNLTSTHNIGEADTNNNGCLCLTMYEGTAEHTASRHAETRELLLACGGTSLGEQPVRQWEKGRFGAPVLRDGLLDSGVICETLETATDWSNVTRLKKAVTKALGDTLAASGAPSIIMCHISHVYSGGCSLYFTVIAAQRHDDPAAQWWPAKKAATQAMVDNGGTITHHHAVGTDHREHIVAEQGDLSIAILRGIKQQVDPAGILNPGKLF
ncbi:MAG: FAD-binding oxidoreductase [Corynebacterium sp.]|nr:FAD-binding oxidoreductase [Corynebacterium sp.]